MRHCAPVNRTFNYFLVFLGLLALLLTSVTIIFNGSTSAKAAATSQPIRAAFYYGWFPETWHSGDKNTPALGQYSSSNQSVVAAQISEAKYAGLNAFISSWWGVGTPTDNRLPILLNAAGAQSFSVAPYYEEEGTTNNSVATIQKDLTRLSLLASSPAWLHVNGKPVLFVYNALSSTSTCAETTKWKTATAGKWYVDLKVFSGYTKCVDQPDSWHQYGPASPTQSHLPYSFEVSPGFNKYTESSPRLARDVSRFEQNLTSQVLSSAQWQLITSWNEWGEGTAVEPALEWESASGFGAYLDAMRAVYVDGQRFTTTPSSSPPTTTTAPSTSAPKTTSAAPSSSAPSSSSIVPSPSVVTTSAAPSTSSSSPPAANVSKVLTIVEENHSLNEMKSGMPYLYGLATNYAYATNYKAIRHPSEPNYLAIAGGSTFGDTTDHNPAFQVAGSSVFGQALSKGKTARSYEESMTSNCQQANGGNYAVKHNPWASFTGERTQCNLGDVPLGSTSAGKLLADVTSGNLPNTGFVTPNMCNDAHDCSLGTADNWLKSWLPIIMSGSDYKSGKLAIVITADEDDSTQSNTVLSVVLNPALSGTHKVVTTSLTHYSLTGLYSQVNGGTLLQNATTGFATAFGINPAP